MKKKLCESRGETLIEVLAAVLVGALSIALLFTAAMASGNMDRLTHDPDGSSGSDDIFYTSLDAAEAQTGSVETGKVKVSDGGVTQEIAVSFYGGKGAMSFVPTPP